MSFGKQISFAPNQSDNEKLLKKAAREGYYYPALAVKQLNSLTSGAFGKNNVYIPNVNDSRAHTLQVFYMYLPGIRATIECRNNTGYVVTALALAEGYKGVAKGDDKPGIYSVSKGQNKDIVTNYRKNGLIKAEDNRHVVICESGYENAIDAANDISRRLDKLVSAGAARDNDFDMMYSSHGLNGMKAFKPMSITDAYASSSLLANAMIKAQKRKAEWVSDGGGSVTLTQAMAIIAQQNIQLSNHSVRMFHPSSNSTTAYHLAQQVGFKLGNDFTTGQGIRGTISSAMTKTQRLINKQDAYSLKDSAKAITHSGMGGVGIAGVGLFGAGLFMQMPLFAGTVVGGIGAAHLLWTKAKNFAQNRRKK